jgi:hypothetical protein
LAEPRFFCSDVSRAEAEPLTATASRIDHWLLLEYRGLWAPDAIRASGLSDQVKGALREQVRARPHTRLLFIRRPDRRGREDLRAYAATSREGEESLRLHSLAGYEDVRTLDLAAGGAPVVNPLFLVCTHGKHDQCCARYGRPVFEALAEQSEEDAVWQSTHVGGDRFAANVVCLPHGIYYGRLDRDDVVALLDEHLAGRILLNRYRGRSSYTFAEQAAERDVRGSASIDGLDSLRLHFSDGTRIAFRDEGATVHARDVFEELGEPRRLTCAGIHERRPLRYRVSRPV